MQIEECQNLCLKESDIIALECWLCLSHEFNSKETQRKRMNNCLLSKDESEPYLNKMKFYCEKL